MTANVDQVDAKDGSNVRNEDVDVTAVTILQRANIDARAAGKILGIKDAPGRSPLFPEVSGDKVMWASLLDMV